MRLITNKQLKAIHNLLSFVNQNKDEFGSNDYDWQKSLQHINHIVMNGTINKMSSTGKDTQGIFKFLINSTKSMDNYISQYNAEMHCIYHDDPNMINRKIVDESSIFY